MIVQSPNDIRRQELADKYNLPANTRWSVIAECICEDFRKEMARHFGLHEEAPWCVINRYR